MLISATPDLEARPSGFFLYLFFSVQSIHWFMEGPRSGSSSTCFPSEKLASLPLITLSSHLLVLQSSAESPRLCQDIYFCSEGFCCFRLVGFSACALFQVCCSSLREEYKPFPRSLSIAKLEQKEQSKMVPLVSDKAALVSLLLLRASSQLCAFLFGGHFSAPVLARRGFAGREVLRGL